jgi:Tfp pilus assembly protein PilE
MSKIIKTEKGFAVLELILIILVLAIVGFAGWWVYMNQHKTVDAKNITTTLQNKTTPKVASTNSYAGWKMYTLPVEKLSLMYPSDWTVSNTALTSTQDDTILTSSDGFSIEISDGNGNGGDPIPEAPASSAVPVKFVGQSDYLAFTYGTGSAGQGSSDGLVDGAVLQTSTNENNGPNDGYTWPTDKYAYQSNPNFGGGPIIPGDPTNYILMGCSLKTQITLQQAPYNSDFKDAELVIASMHY